MRRSRTAEHAVPVAAAAPLARVPGVSLVSLQKGSGSEQRAEVEFSRAIAQLSDPLHAHLAGALGARVWVILQAVPDWRWLTATWTRLHCENR
jgi:hypothetical protein